MKKNLSTLVVLILFYSRAFAVGIDSVWVKEETICNDSNIVSICYILRDGPTRISVSVSDNDGMSWGVPLNTLFDASGDIGDSISSGTHCFYWLMSNDYPGHERRDWLVRIQARSSFIDTFSFLDTTRYMINGNDGYVDVANGYFVLTTPNNDRNGRIMSVDSVYTDTLYVSFDFRMWERGGIIDPLGYQGADGISFILSRYLNPPLALGGAIGIRYTGGIGVGIDNWYNGSPCDMNSNHIEISIDADCGGTGLPTPLYQTDIPFELIDGNWHHVEISILGQHWVVLVDGVTYFDVVLSPTQYQPFWAYVGFAASTGGSYCWQVIDNFRVVSPYMYTVESERIIRAPLDSRRPRINLSCTTEPVVAGDSVQVFWSVDDIFYSRMYGAELIFSACGYNERRNTIDTTSFFRTPRIDCPNAYITVSLQDSFCNTQSATCSLRIDYRPFDIRISLLSDSLVCLPSGRFSPETLTVKAIVANIGSGRADSVRVNLDLPHCFRLISPDVITTIAPFLPAEIDTINYRVLVDRSCEGTTQCIRVNAQGF